MNPLIKWQWILISNFALMQVFTTPNKIIITCHKWLAPALSKEVVALGFTPDRVFQTSVRIQS